MHQEQIFEIVIESGVIVLSTDLINKLIRIYLKQQAKVNMIHPKI